MNKENYFKNKKNIDILAALLIGGRDVHMYKNQYTKQYYLNYTCVKNRKEYIKHVAKTLQPLSKKEVKKFQYKCQQHKTKSLWKESNYAYFKTDSHEELTILRKEFYNSTKRRKIIPENIDEYMSEEFILWLYLECGCVEQNIDYFYPEYKFKLHHWDEESLEKLRESIEKNLKIEAYVEEDYIDLYYIGISLFGGSTIKMTQILEKYKNSLIVKK